jgi:hypothetical protein
MPYDKKPNKRPDIATLGASLLADKRSYSKKNDRSKDDMKDLGKLLLLQMGIGIGNKFLKDKSEHFIKNEKVNADRLRYKQAVRDSESVLSTKKLIDASGLSTQEYFAKENRPIVTQGMSEAMTEELKNKDAYDSYITELSRSQASEQAKAFNDSLKYANQIGSPEDFEAMVNLRNTRPSSIGEFAVDKVFNLFKGQSQAEVDNAAYESISKSAMMQNANRLSAFTKAFNKTKNLPAAYDYALAIVPDKDKVETIEQSSTTHVAQGTINVVTKDTTTNNITGDVKVSNHQVQTIKVDDAAKDPAKLVTALNAGFNFAKDTKPFLTTNGMEMFNRALLDEDILVTHIKTPQEYARASEIYADMVSIEGNMRDEFQEQGALAASETLFKEISKIDMLLASVEDDPIKKAAEIEKLIKTKADILASFKEMYPALDVRSKPKQGQSINYEDL